MSMWQVLEIEPTGEVKEIKRAYAKKLKRTNPEDDPEGFQVLKEAYDGCLRYAKNYKKNIEYNDLSLNYEDLDIVHSEEEFNENDNGDIYKEINNQSFVDLIIENNEDDLDEDNYKTPPRINIKEEEVNLEVNYSVQIDVFFEKVQALYDDFFKRIDLMYWKELLSDEVMWRFELKSQIGARMADFLIENYCLPRDVFKLLCQDFQLNEEKWHTYYDYPSEIVNYIFLQLSDEDKITGYNYLDEKADVDFNKYVKYREDAFIALMNIELGSARKLILLAEEIYDKDPYLKCMNSEYYVRINDDITARDNFNAARELAEDDIAIYLYQAKTYTYAKKIDKAIKVYRFLVNRNPEDLGLMELLGKSYIENSDFVNASKVFREILEINPRDGVARDYLTRIFYHIKDQQNSKNISRDLKKECKNIKKALNARKIDKDLKVRRIEKDLKTKKLEKDLKTKKLEKDLKTKKIEEDLKAKKIEEDLKAKNINAKSGEKATNGRFSYRLFGYLALIAAIIRALAVIGKNVSSETMGNIIALLLLASIMYSCFKYFKKARSRNVQGIKRLFYMFLNVVIAIVALADLFVMIVGVLDIMGLA